MPLITSPPNHEYHSFCLSQTSSNAQMEDVFQRHSNATEITIVETSLMRGTVPQRSVLMERYADVCIGTWLLLRNEKEKGVDFGNGAVC